MKKGAVVAGLSVATLASACAPMSVSHYQSAKPIPAGSVMFGGGFQIPKDGGHGLEADQTKGAPLLTHHAASDFLDNLDAEVHYGLDDRIEISGQLWLTGAEAGGRFTYMNTPEVKGALGLYVGGFQGGYTVTVSDGSGNSSDEDRKINGLYVDIPLTLSIHPSDYFAIYGGPVITRIDARSTDTEHSNGSTTTSVTRGADYWAAGGFAGICVGREMQFSIGSTFYLERSTYPVQNFSGNGIYAYPFVGLTFTTGGVRPTSLPTQ